MLFTVIAIVVVLACTHKSRTEGKEFAVEFCTVLKDLYSKAAWLEIKEGTATAWADTKKALKGLVAPLKWVGLILTTYTVFIPLAILLLIIILIAAPFARH